MKEKLKYVTPELEVTEISVSDIIATSSDPENDEDYSVTYPL